MTLQKLTSCLLLAGLAAATATAQADVTFETRLSNVAFSVTDLTPDDGIGAGYDYSLDFSFYGLGLYSPPVEKAFAEYDAVGPLQHELIHGNSQVSLGSASTPGEYTLQGAIRDNLGADGGGSAWVQQHYAFTLTANSALNVSANLFMHISPSSNSYREGWAATSFMLWSPDSALRIDERADLTLPWNGGEVLDQDYSFTYANTTDQAITVNVWLWSTSTASIAAVPEPSTYAMLGLGLLTLAQQRGAAVNLPSDPDASPAGRRIDFASG